MAEIAIQIPCAVLEVDCPTNGVRPIEASNSDNPYRTFYSKFRPSTAIMQKMLAEVISTFILVFTGCGSIVVNAMTDGGVTALGIDLIFGLVVAAMVYAVGHISMCHMNPAVTIAFAIAKKCRWSEVPLYIVSECIGSTLAMFMVKGILTPTHAELVTAVTQPRESIMQSFWLEIVITFVLMFVVAAVATDTRARGELAGIVVGSTVALLALFSGPISGCSMNPARSLGPAIVSGHYHALWIYIVAPVIGAVLGLLAYNIIRMEDKPSDASD